MLTVKFPALPSYFIGEDAILRRYKFWDEIKSLITHKCYPYPIVYTDGLISYVASDGKSRIPYGFVLSNYIIPFNASEYDMTPVQALFQCRSVIFANRKGELPSVEILRYIRGNFRKINKLIDAFDGTIFQRGPYLSCEKCSPHIYVAINFGTGYFLTNINNSIGEIARFRPVINIAHL